MSRPPRWLRPVAATLLAAPFSLLAAASLAAEAPDAGTAAQEATVVAVRSFAYEPDPVQISSGASLRWRWHGEDRHSVTAVDRSFDSDPDCEDNVLLRGNCRTGGSEDFVWTAPEVTERTEIAYACKLHGSSQGMTGTVVVVPPPPPPSSPSPEPPDGPSPSPSASASPDDRGGSGGSGSGGDDSDRDDAADRGPRTGSAPQLGTQTAPGSSPPSVASPEVAAPLAEPDLEPFPSPAPVPTETEEDLGEVAVDLPEDDGGTTRTILLAVATVGVTGTAVAFGSLVLFGPRWR